MARRFFTNQSFYSGRVIPTPLSEDIFICHIHEVSQFPDILGVFGP